MQNDFIKLSNILKGGENLEAPQRAIDFPSMTTRKEKELLYRLARYYFKGEGFIIDAGLFLGASTNAMCWGIKANKLAYNNIIRESLRPLQSYDIARWHSVGFDKYLNDPLVRKALGTRVFENGEDYSSFLKTLLSEHANLIEFYFGDIIKTAENNNERSIEIAFYDCLKNYERDWAAFKAFGPNYVAGHTIIVQQDYFYEDALENKIRQEFLGDYFEYLGRVDSSAVFRLSRPLPAKYFETDPLLSIGVDDGIKLLDAACARVDASAHRIYTEAGVVRYMLANGRLDDAMKRLIKIKALSDTLPLPPRAIAIVREMEARVSHLSQKGDTQDLSIR